MTDNELNEMVAEKVMGFVKLRYVYPSPYPNNDGILLGTVYGQEKPIPDYANDIAAAWQVWWRMKTSTVWAEFCDALSRGEYYKTMAMIYPKTICLAALDAFGVTV